MKKNKQHIYIITAAALLYWAYAPLSVCAEITGNMHDFSNYPGANGEVCVVCHTPHNASSNVIPLWNHATTTSTFTTYSSSTLNAAVGSPSASSKACLSCHDGTVAINSFGGQIGNKFPYSSYIIDPNLSNDHPVSFIYDSALAAADNGLEDPSVKTVPQVGSKTIDQALLTEHKMECSSCHDVHAAKGDAATPSTDYLLIVSSNESALCLTCHKK